MVVIATVIIFISTMFIIIATTIGIIIFMIHNS